MLYSKLFGKTVREAPANAGNISYKLLHQAGFIRESTSGRYFILPLGQRVQQKIMQIIKEEMDSAGAQEMLSPVLHPLELWKETNRTKTTGFELMRVKDDIYSLKAKINQQTTINSRKKSTHSPVEKFQAGESIKFIKSPR